MLAWFRNVTDARAGVCRYDSFCVLVSAALASGCATDQGRTVSNGQAAAPMQAQNNTSDGASTAGTTANAPTQGMVGTAGKAALPNTATSSGSAAPNTSNPRAEAAAGSSASAAIGGAGGSNVQTNAGTNAAGSGTAGAFGAPADNGVRFPSVTDFAGPGPYMGVTMSGSGPGGGYTVYHPEELAPGGAKNPIVGWMSGGSTNPSAYPLLPHLATHGFVVVASNTTPGIGEEVALGQEIIAGIDWAIAENARPDSPFFEKLDTTKLASMGYSMGSLATFTIANDPRLTTTIHISGGNMVTERVENLHAPAAFFCGIPGDANCNILSDACDIAAANCDTDFAAATTPVFYGNFPGGHLGILSEPNQGAIHTEVTAWLRWQLMLDATIAPRFVGDQCSVCKDSRWQKVQQKNL